MRTWKDEIVNLFIDGRLEPASAAQVRAAMDRIAANASLVASLERLDAAQLRPSLAKLLPELLAEQRSEGAPAR